MQSVIKYSIDNSFICYDMIIQSNEHKNNLLN